MSQKMFQNTVQKINPQETTHITLFAAGCVVSILILGAALQISHGTFQSKALLAVTLSILVCAAVLLLPRCTLLLPFRRESALRRSFFVILALYFIAGCVALRYVHPPIDVLLLEDESEHTLLHGMDPYGRNVTHEDIYSSYRTDVYGTETTANGRVKLGFPYPPLTLLWILPGYLLGDVRYSFLLAVVLSALMLFRNQPNLNGFVAAILLLFVPDTIYVLRFGWTEPLMVMTVVATVLAARRASWWLPVALGLFLASKQYSLLAVPLVPLLLSRFSWKAYGFLLAKAALVAAAVNVPFLLWDPRGFWWSLVGFRLMLPLRLDALSFSALLGRHGFPPIPQWFVFVAVVAAVIFCLKWAPKTSSGFAVSLALVSLVFFVTNIGAFCNYYFFCGATLCLGLSGNAYDSAETFYGLVKLPDSACDGLEAAADVR